MKFVWIKASVFFCALGLRLWHFFEIRHIDYITSQNTDLFQFMYYAEKMYAGTFFLQQKIFFNLLYPLFLTVVHYAAGFSIEQILLLQLTLDACSAVLVAAIVMNVSGKRAGSIAGFMYACYGPIIFYAGLPLAPCLTVFLMLISCFCLLRLIDENRPNPLWGIGAGLCFALVTIARPNSIIVLPAVLFLLWLRFRGEMKMLIRAAVILCISVVLPLVPFMVHNYATVATLSPYSLNGGINLYMGNHAGALGVMQTVEGVESSPGKQVIDSIRRASEKTGKVLSVKDANAYWVREALRFYLTDPGSGIVLLLRKAGIFLNTHEFACNNDYVFYKRFSRVMQLPLIVFGCVIPFVFIGLCIDAKKRYGLLLLKLIFGMLFLSVVLCYVTARLRIVCVPFAIMLAALGINRMMTYVKTKNYFPGALAVVGIVCMLTVSYRPVNSYGFKLEMTSSINHTNYGIYLFHKTRYENAAQELESAIEFHQYNSDAYTYLGKSYERLGKFEQALEAYEPLIDAGVANIDVFSAAGRLYMRKGQVASASEVYEQAYQLNPSNPLLCNTLGAVLISMNNLKSAERYLQEAIKLKHDYPDPYYNLSVVAYGRKNYQRAAGFLEKAEALGLEPDPRYVRQLASVK